MEKSNTITTIFFDWGGVLIENPTPGFVSYCCDKINITPDQFEKLYKKVSFEFERGLINELDMWNKMLSQSGSNVNIPKHSLWREAFESIYRPIPEMFEIATQLQEKGLNTGLLSNTEIPAMEFFLEQNYKMLSPNTYSCAEGVAKPQPEIYLRALNKMQVRPHQALFIDDRSENINAARNCGLHTHHFISIQSFKSALHDFGINPA